MTKTLRHPTGLKMPQNQIWLCSKRTCLKNYAHYALLPYRDLLHLKQPFVGPQGPKNNHMDTRAVFFHYCVVLLLGLMCLICSTNLFEQHITPWLLAMCTFEPIGHFTLEIRDKTQPCSPQSQVQLMSKNPRLLCSGEEKGGRLFLSRPQQDTNEVWNYSCLGTHEA